MKQVRLTIAYDGSRFAGWQIQPNRPTFQGEIENALERLTGLPVRAHSAGRTDAGVHALGQVAGLRSPVPEGAFTLESISARGNLQIANRYRRWVPSAFHRSESVAV